MKGCYVATTGEVITIDAMGCQKVIAKTILDKEADYLLGVKSNQERLEESRARWSIEFQLHWRLDADTSLKLD